MTSVTSYGIQLERGDGDSPEEFAVIGEATSVDFPKWVTAALETTNHSSSGYREYKGSKLAGAEAFSATYNCDATIIATVKADMIAKRVGNFRITDLADFTSIIFEGFFLSFQILGADAATPDIIRCQIEIQPSGDLNDS